MSAGFLSHQHCMCDGVNVSLLISRWLVRFLAPNYDTSLCSWSKPTDKFRGQRYLSDSQSLSPSCVSFYEIAIAPLLFFSVPSARFYRTFGSSDSDPYRQSSSDRQLSSGGDVGEAFRHGQLIYFKFRPDVLLHRWCWNDDGGYVVSTSSVWARLCNAGV